MYLFYFTVFTGVLTTVSTYGFRKTSGQVERKSNDSLVVVVDPNFMFSKRRNLMSSVKNIVRESCKKHLEARTLNIDFHDTPDLTSRSDITAVVSIASCEDTWKIVDSVQEDGVLFIAFTEPQCPRLPESLGLTIPLTDANSEMMQLILDLRTSNTLNLKSVTILHDDTVGNSMIKSITEVLTIALPTTGSSCTISLFEIRSSEKNWEKSSNVFNLLPKQRGGNYIIFVSLAVVGPVIEAAKSMKLIEPTSRWLFFITDNNVSGENITNYTPLIGDGENIAFVYNTTNSNVTCSVGLFCHLEEIVQSFSLTLDRAIQEESDLSEQVSDEEWEVIRPGKVQRRNSLLFFMKNNLKENGNCSNCTRWELQTSENWGRDYMGKGTWSKLLPIGHWSPISGPAMTDHLFPHFENGFRGRTLPISTFHYPPWQIIRYNQSGIADQFKGLSFEILKELARSLNFTFNIINLSNSSSNYNTRNKASTNPSEFQQLDDVIFGASTELSAWDKTMDIIQKKKMFLGAIGFTVTEERKPLVSFTIPISIEPYAFLASRPKELSRALLFIRPFTSDTWLCIIGAVLIMTPLLNFAHRLSPFYEHYGIREKGGFHRMMNCFWYLYGALLQQGGAVLPEADSGRLVIGTWWLVVLVVVTTYSGNLVAFLTFPKMEKIISNVDEVLGKKDSVTWGFPAISTLSSLLKKTDDKKLNELCERATLHSELTPDIISQIRSGAHIYIEKKSNLLFLMKREFLSTNSCDFSFGQEEFLEEHLAMVMPRGSPYLDLVNQEISRMHKTGLIQKWTKDYLPKRDRCWASGFFSGENTHTVNIRDMQGSFFLLLFGIFLGILLIWAEYLFRKWRRKQETGLIHPFVN